MSHFAIPIDLYMSAPVYTVTADDDLAEVQRRLSGLSVSSLAVVDGDERLVGIITRTDLIRVGRRQAGSRGRAPLLTLPSRPVSKYMTKEVVTLTPDDRVSLAAKRMVEKHVHRIVIERDGRPVGVLSTRDVMRAIGDKKLAKPIAQWMSSPVFTVRHDEPVALATERLEKARVTGLVVVDDGWPVGLYTQEEALDARDLPRETKVDDAMSASLLALPVDTPLHRAAAQAAATHVRRVIAVKGRSMEGILTGIDFARAAV